MAPWTHLWFLRSVNGPWTHKHTPQPGSTTFCYKSYQERTWPSSRARKCEIKPQSLPRNRFCSGEKWRSSDWRMMGKKQNTGLEPNQKHECVKTKKHTCRSSIHLNHYHLFKYNYQGRKMSILRSPWGIFFKPFLSTFSLSLIGWSAALDPSICPLPNYQPGQSCTNQIHEKNKTLCSKTAAFLLVLSP